jgi:hypothetical protein
MNIEQYFNSIDLAEIKRFIRDQQEEHVSLEFKTVNHPTVTDLNREDDKKNFSKILSGFANSQGGIVIWGIKAKEIATGQDVAFEEKPISQLTKFLNTLNRLEGQSVIPKIEGVINSKIEISKDIGFVKTFVPASQIAPHMAHFAGKHYYKRSGDSFYQCEHFDIMDMFSRKRSPDLELSIRVAKKHDDGRFHQYFIIISITNKGKAIGRYLSLSFNLKYGFSVYEYGLGGNRDTGLKPAKNNLNFMHNYSGGIDQVIHPDSIIDVDKCSYYILKESAPPDFSITYSISAENFETKTGSLAINSEQIIRES